MAWRYSPGHQAWLGAEAQRLLSFYENAADWDGGGFFWLDDAGRPVTGRPKELWINARLVHCFALGSLLGRPGCGRLAEHGLRGLRERFRDARHGGWYAAAAPARTDGPADPRKQAYGHAFVLLAACTAAQAGHDTHDLIQEASDVIAARMLDRPHGLYVEEWDRGWTECAGYRGQNANMHLAEAFLAAADATGDEGYAGHAAHIAERIVGEFAAADLWRVPEHYDSAWRPVPEFNAGRPRDLFRPYGTIPGHSLEWARLLIQLHERPGTPGAQGAWMPGAAVDLFRRAVADAWDEQRTGFAYTLRTDGSVSVADRFHWVIAEAIGAAAYLHAATGDAAYDGWYQRFWDHAALHVLDRTLGSWRHELTPQNTPGSEAWQGKPDLYHALQATLFGRLAPAPGIGSALEAENRP